MIHRCLIAFAIAASLAAADGAPPADPQPVANPEPFFVDHVDGTTIFVKIFGSDETVATDAKTVITLDGKPAGLAELRKGDHLIHIVADAGKATRVEAVREKGAGNAPKK